MSLTTQFYTMITMIGMGSYFGAALDTYQYFLNRGERKRWIVFLNDITFWLLQALLIFYVLFVVNQGELRTYLFLALLCGFAAYQSLLKKSYLFLLKKTIQMIVQIARWIKKVFLLLVFNPIKGLVGWLLSLLIMVGKGILTLAKWVGILLLWIGKIIFYPFKVILKGFWNLLPNNVKKSVGHFFNFLAGVLKKSKNSIQNFLFKDSGKK